MAANFGQNAKDEWHARPVSTLAAVVTMICVGAGLAAQWGIMSHRLDSIERERDEDRRAIGSQLTTNATQDARIAVLESRIAGIEETTRRTEGKIDALLAATKARAQ